jgi:TolC family type I secretion outer membrane protein
MTMSRSWILTLGLAAGAAAVAAAQQPAPSQPPALAAPQPAAVAAQEPGSAMRRVTLADALQLARQYNPALVQARQNLRVANMGVTQAWGAYLPAISGTAGSSKSSSQRYNSATGQVVSAPGNQSTFGLNASLNLFTGFQRGANQRAASANRDLDQAAVLQQDYATDLSTKQAFFNALSTQELVGVAQANLARSDQQLKLTSEKLRLGATTRADSLQASVDYGNAQVQLIQARANALTAQANLARAIGSEGMVAAIPDTALEVRLPALDTVALRHDAEASAPSVVQAQAGVAAARASLAANRAVYFPTLSLGASQRWAGQILFPWTSVAAGPKYTGTWSLSLSLNYPIFNGFQREANIVNADANYQSSQARLRDARLGLDASLTQELTALDAAGAQIDVARTTVAAAQEALRMQRERYRLGASTIVDLLTAETTLNQAEVGLVQARYNYLIARAQIEALVGHSL